VGIIYAALVINPTHPLFQQWYVGQTTKKLSARRWYHESVPSSKAFMHVYHLKPQDLEWYTLAKADSITHLHNLEKEWIVILDSKDPHGLNRTSGGEGTPGIRRTPEWREKISRALTGRKLSLEQRLKLSARMKESRYRLAPPWGNRYRLGAKHTEETRQKMRDAWDYKKHMTAQTLEKMRIAGLARRKDLEAHLQTSAVFAPETGCLLWTGYVCNGSPAYEQDDKMRYVRREIAARSLGVTPDRLSVVRRICESKLCVLLDHLRFQVAE
jgi:NUMOD3 motif